MGALARALKAKFRTPREALEALGLDPALIDIKQLAKDSKLRRGRDGMVDGAEAEEMRAARNLSGSAFEDEQLRINRQMEHEMTDDDEEERRDEYDEEEPRFFGGRNDEEERKIRRFRMRQLADHLTTARDAGGQGLSHNDAAEILRDFPRNELEHMNASVFDEDLESVMEKLTGMGGTSTTGYPPKAGDRRKMAKDARLATKHFGLDRLEGRSNEMLRYGDRAEPLAMDEATESANADSFAAFFPDAARIKTNAL